LSRKEEFDGGPADIIGVGSMGGSVGIEATRETKRNQCNLERLKGLVFIT
jgi:hypothetical protein